MQVRMAGHNDLMCVQMVHRDVRRLTQLCVAYVPKSPTTARPGALQAAAATSRPSTSASAARPSPRASRLAERPSTSAVTSASGGRGHPSQRPGAVLHGWRNWQMPSIN